MVNRFLNIYRYMDHQSFQSLNQLIMWQRQKKLKTINKVDKVQNGNKKFRSYAMSDDIDAQMFELVSKSI